MSDNEAAPPTDPATPQRDVRGRYLSRRRAQKAAAAETPAAAEPAAGAGAAGAAGAAETSGTSAARDDATEVPGTDPTPSGTTPPTPPPGAHRSEEDKRRRRWWLLLLLLLLLLLCCCGGYFFYWKDRDKSEPVPAASATVSATANVPGASPSGGASGVASASAAASASAGAPSGSAAPSASTEPQPSPSAAIDTATVPNVVGQKASTGVQILTDAGFSTITCKDASGNVITALDGYVVTAQSPKAGTIVPVDTPIALTCKPQAGGKG